MKVFQVNDCDWVAANSFEEAKDWYVSEYGVEDDECWLEEECDVNKLIHVLWDELPEYEKENTRLVQIKQESKEIYVQRSYKWIIENIHNNQQTPFLIASTEY